MKKKLIIDGKNLGDVIGYRQNRELKRWVFLMQGGYYISVDWANIKLFISSLDLEIITYNSLKTNFE